jgi:hypothetical protein
MRVRILTCVILLVLILSNPVSAQIEIQTGVLLQPRTTNVPGTALNGLSLLLNYRHEMTEKWNVGGGLEFQGNSFGNHLLLQLQTSYFLLDKNNWSTDVNIQMGNGIAMYRPNVLYTFNTRLLIFENFKTTKQHQWSFGTGFQYITSPGYSNYSSKHAAFNFPMVVKYRF